MPKNMHTSPKTAPGQTPPRTATTHPATMRLHAFLTTPFAEKTKYTKRKSVTFCARGYSDVIVGCRKRSNDDLHRARQGVVSRARTKRLSKARAMQGRAGQGGTGTPFRKKISLASSTNEDVVDTGGVVFKKHHSTGCLPTCDSQARMRTAGSNIHRAATRSRPYPSRTPLDTRTCSKR